ncbi:MAG: efflux RND transporter permease subunit [Sphaerochaetaceae bacterium]
MEYSKIKDVVIVAIAIVLAIASLSLIGSLHIDSSTDAFMPSQHETVKINERIEEQFGSIDAIMVAITTANDSILEPDALQVIDQLTDDIEKLPTVKQALSLTNTDHMQEGLDGFEAVPLFSGTSDLEIASLRERLHSWKEVYEGNLISSDEKMATIVIQSEAGSTQHQTDELLDNVVSLVNEIQNGDLTYSFIGLPLIKQQINRSLLSDVASLAPIVGLLIILVLLFSFRKLSGVILPLVGLVISAAISLGIMAIFNITVTMATMLVPVLLLIVGSAYAIHIMSHFYEEIVLFHGVINVQQTHQTISMVVKRNRIPIIMAGATTAAGFIAQFTSPLEPFRTFGLLSAIGVVLSQISSLYLLPALLRLTYSKPVDVGKFRAKEKKDRPLRSQKMFSLFEKWALKRKATLLVISVMLCALTLFLVPSIKVGTNMLKFFHPSTKLVQDTNLYNKHMSGSGMLTILIDSHTDGDILEPQFLATLEKFAHDIESLDGVGKVQSITPYLKRMNLLMNQDKEPYKEVVSEQADFDFFGGDFGFFGDEPLFEEIYEEPATWDPQTYFEIPTEAAKYGLQTNQDLKNLLSQYLLLYSGNLGLLINDDLEPSSTLITIQMKNTDNGFVRNIRNQIQEYWDDSLPSGWDYAVGGGEAVALALTDLVTTSQIYSLGGALLIVWVLVSFIFRSPIAGLFGLIPVLFALMGIFIFMVLFTIQLDVITSLLAALAIGIGVDYAIHFISACQRLGGKSCEDGGLSVIMRTTGRAIIINAASVTIGFAGLIFSRFIPIRQMGILFCVSMIFSAFSSLTVLPMALISLKPKFLFPQETTDNTKEQRRVSP